MPQQLRMSSFTLATRSGHFLKAQFFGRAKTIMTPKIYDPKVLGAENPGTLSVCWRRRRPRQRPSSERRFGPCECCGKNHQPAELVEWLSSVNCSMGTCSFDTKISICPFVDYKFLRRIGQTSSCLVVLLCYCIMGFHDDVFLNLISLVARKSAQNGV